MSESGICSNDTYPESRLSADQATRYGFTWCRSIVYGSEDSQNAVIEAARARKPYCKTLVVITTETTGLVVEDVDGYGAWLDQFLARADGAIDAIEGGNELDDPLYRTGSGGLITPDLMIAIGRKTAEVCHKYGILAGAPSIIGDPAAGNFEALARGVVGHCDFLICHPYYCSVRGFPSRPDLNGEPNKWRFGTIEEKADICQRLGQGMPTWFTEWGIPTVFDDLSPVDQATGTVLYQEFEHPAIPVALQFCLTDAMAPGAELDDHKFWGILNADGSEKESAKALAALVGSLPVEVPPPAQTSEFVLGFHDMHAAYPDLIGDPLFSDPERGNEHGWARGFSEQDTTNGTLAFANTVESGPVLGFTDRRDGTRYRWDGSVLRPV